MEKLEIVSKKLEERINDSDDFYLVHKRKIYSNEKTGTVVFKVSSESFKNFGKNDDRIGRCPHSNGKIIRSYYIVGNEEGYVKVGEILETNSNINENGVLEGKNEVRILRHGRYLTHFDISAEAEDISIYKNKLDPYVDLPTIQPIKKEKKQIIKSGKPMFEYSFDEPEISVRLNIPKDGVSKYIVGQLENGTDFIAAFELSDKIPYHKDVGREFERITHSPINQIKGGGYIYTKEKSDNLVLELCRSSYDFGRADHNKVAKTLRKKGLEAIVIGD